MGVSGRFAAAYYGCTQLPQGFGQVDLASTVAELRREEPIRTSIEITSGKLIIYRADGLEIFKHSVHYITSINTVSREKSLLAYITKSVTALGAKEYTQYVFRLECSEKVSELFTAVRDEKKSTVPQILNKSLHNVSGSTSLCGDSPPNLSTFYEVLFLGKIKVSHRRAPPTFIDEAVNKISNKTRKQDSQDTNLEQENIPVESAAHPLSKNLPARPSLCDVIQAVTPKPEEKPEEQPSKIMLMQIGRNDIRLISPDTKQVLVHKTFREISHCSCGQEYNLNFGFICKEERGESAGYVGYIFQCDSTHVVEDIMQGLKSAFYTAHETARKERMEQQCPSCPMIWFNQLCNELEGLPANKAQSALLRKVESLGEVGSGILAKMEGAETTDIDEQNQILMMLLKANCEVKQGVHEHIPGSIFSISRERTPPPQLQESVLAEAAKKAKRSLADSFNIIRRRASVDVSGESSAVPNISVERPTPVKITPSKALHPFSVTLAERMLRDKSMSPDLSHLPPRSPLQPLTPDKHVAFQCELPNSGGGDELLPTRQRARTVGSAGGETMKRELAKRRLARLAAERIEEEDLSCSPLSTSPQISIFKKTGAKSPNCDVTTSRQHIYNKVVTPGKKKAENQKPHQPRNYRELWKTAVKQQILLNRMEKENLKMQAHERVLAEKRLKLDYEDLIPLSPHLVQQWDTILQKGGLSYRRSEIRSCIGQGVHKGRRGEIWSLIVTQAGEKTPVPTDEFASKFSEWGKGYSELRCQLTSHQHAILIDLGRTFPNHGYFSGALGPGQLGMFNLLKSYSILDPEVGYCQGLPFLVGLLLMHLEEEEEAFNLLKFIMFDLQLRNMFKPDMTGLQVAMYQLTRLLSETQPALYKLLDRLEVDPSLYATPWFLTLFAAHFPLGFVSRVLDLIFIEGKSAIIKVGMCLLVQASRSLLSCDSIEEIMDTIKTELPGLPKSSLEDVIKQAACLNVSKQLKTYEVEYSVIQEEISLSETGTGESYEAISTQNNNLKIENKRLLDRVLSLEEELRVEKEKNKQNLEIQKDTLEAQNMKIEAERIKLEAEKLMGEAEEIRLEAEKMKKMYGNGNSGIEKEKNGQNEFRNENDDENNQFVTMTNSNDEVLKNNREFAKQEQSKEINGNICKNQVYANITDPSIS